MNNTKGEENIFNAKLRTPDDVLKFRHSFQGRTE